MSSERPPIAQPPPLAALSSCQKLSHELVSLESGQGSNVGQAGGVPIVFETSRMCGTKL